MNADKRLYGVLCSFLISAGMSENERFFIFSCSELRVLGPLREKSYFMNTSTRNGGAPLLKPTH